MSNISKNFQNQPPSAPISTSMHIGAGGQSSQMYEPDANAPASKNFAKPGNQAVSRNFTEAAKAAKAAQKPQGGATHGVFRRGW